MHVCLVTQDQLVRIVQFLYNRAMPFAVSPVYYPETGHIHESVLLSGDHPQFALMVANALDEEKQS